MKKLIAGLVLAVMAVSANAQHYHGPRHHHHGPRHHNSWNWVLPAVIGGAIVYGATRQYQPPPPVVVQPQVVPPPPYGYRYEQYYDMNCNCYRVIAVPNY